MTHDNTLELSGSNSNALNRLCAAGLLPKNEMQNVHSLLSRTRAPIDQALSSLGLVTEDNLADHYADVFSLPRWRRETAQPDPALLRATNIAFINAHRMLPLSLEDDVLTVAIVDPSDERGLSGLSFAFGKVMRLTIVTASEFEQLVASLTSAHDNDGTEETASIDADAATLKDLGSAEPAVRLVNRLIGEAWRNRASDIHIEPKERDVHIRRRVDGVLTISERLTRAQALTAVSRLKILAGLDIAERRRPQDGRLSLPVGGRPVDMRVSTTPTIHGESVVIRLLEKPAAASSLDALGFSAPHAARLNGMISRPNGILLITGPTGSGKTTTLYALLEILAKRDLKILTIEDPVEYRIEGVSQTQVNPTIDLDFANAMRSFLRHDPDVIMVGEMRDLETARTAVQAALTGHLVLSTLHTNDAPSAVSRLLDMGIDDFLVASTLIGVVAQRLVRRLCGACGGNRTEGGDCSGCQGAGYAGRLAVGEILDIDDALKARLRAGVTASELKAFACSRGFEPMQTDAGAKLRAGLTDANEVSRVLGVSDEAS